MNKLLYLTFLAYIFLFTVTISSASPTLNKRWCECTMAFTNFNSTYLSGRFRIIFDLTKGLNVQINKDSSTRPFNHIFSDLQLTCGSHPVLDLYTMVQGNGENGAANF
ncbi:hypothetical protein RhiirC2_757496 [Rhizophagus irregularis]|uniref:Uncharacterized protein n=1 Tax=Rhizophagus irregularis TaxID=588596 RepID=A0A2N1MQQ0_9GLOM|nr:hypothetical protein RhiirC2_757496 [Rhizophagus irregularis]